MTRDPWSGHTDPDRWTSIRCRGEHLSDRRPEVGEVFGIRYGAWRVIEVRDDHEANWTDEDRKHYERCSPRFKDRLRPHHVVVELVCGPNLIRPGRDRLHLRGQNLQWVLLGERYALCSCHGHPWPCQDADRDRVAAMQAKVMDKEMAKAIPGVCASCGEPITARQKTVTYPGENLNVPTGLEPRFHLRAGCREGAEGYERRWVAVDPRRERILTYPKCPGTLIVHGDGSSECRQGVFDCAGHLTHDHGARSACYCADSNQCPRGCDPRRHPGTRTTPRPPRVTYAQPTL